MTREYQQREVDSALAHATGLVHALQRLAMEPAPADLPNVDRLLIRLGQIGEVVTGAAHNRRVVPHAEEEWMAAWLFEAARGREINPHPSALVWNQPADAVNVNDVHRNFQR